DDEGSHFAFTAGAGVDGAAVTVNGTIVVEGAARHREAATGDIVTVGADDGASEVGRVVIELCVDHRENASPRVRAPATEGRGARADTNAHAGLRGRCVVAILDGETVGGETVDVDVDDVLDVHDTRLRRAA